MVMEAFICGFLLIQMSRKLFCQIQNALPIIEPKEITHAAVPGTKS